MPDMTWINFQINPELKDKLEIMAGEDDRSMSAFMRNLIRREWQHRAGSDCQDDTQGETEMREEITE